MNTTESTPAENAQHLSFIDHASAIETAIADALGLQIQSLHVMVNDLGIAVGGVTSNENRQSLVAHVATKHAKGLPVVNNVSVGI